MFIVFDLDDTLADTEHRYHLLLQEYSDDTNKWDVFFNACDKDKPKKEIISILNSLARDGRHRIEIWTGRSDLVRQKTEDWLKKYLDSDLGYIPLRMRKQGDFRTDIKVKMEWVKEHGKPDVIFDDRNKMVKLWRDMGITCCQVKEADF